MTPRDLAIFHSDARRPVSGRRGAHPNGAATDVPQANVTMMVVATDFAVNASPRFGQAAAG